MSVTATARTVFLPAAEPFDFAATLRFVRGFPAMTGEQGVEPDALTVALREGGAVVGARLTASPEHTGLSVRLYGTGDLGEGVVDAVRDRLTFHLGLDDDLTEFYALADGDPPFGSVVARLHGYHQVKFPSPIELLVWAILGQRVPMPRARAMKHAIMNHFGNEVAVEGETLQAFPDLDQLCSLGKADFEQLIGNARKAGYLYGSLQEWPQIGESFLRTGPYDAVRERLLALPGIGPWSATFLLVRGLGRTERMTADKEALQAAARVYGRPVDESEFAALAGRYGTWQGYWGHYLRVAG